MLKNKVVIVTGGASGLGKATCFMFAEEGARVVVADYNIIEAKRVATEIEEKGGEALPLWVNVADKTSVEDMVYHTKRLLGRIDVLINNAGITRDSTIAKMTDEQWNEVLATNQTGPYNCIKAVIPHMIEQGYGRIINTSSCVGVGGGFGQVNYAATKAALIGMTKSLAKELGKKGILTNAVAPGFILTDMVKKMPEKVIKKMEESIPVGHLGEPNDIALAYKFLAETEYANGCVLEVDGGILF